MKCGKVQTKIKAQDQTNYDVSLCTASFVSFFCLLSFTSKEFIRRFRRKKAEEGGEKKFTKLPMSMKVKNFSF